MEITEFCIPSLWHSKKCQANSFTNRGGCDVLPGYLGGRSMITRRDLEKGLVAMAVPGPLLDPAQAQEVTGAPASAAPAKITVQFGTNRNRTRDGSLFGTGFLDPSDPSAYLTGSIDVIRSDGVPHPVWTPDPATLRLDPTLRQEAGHPLSVDEAAASIQAGGGIVAFAEDEIRAERASAGAGGIVFLPGFNNTFLQSMSSSAQVASGYGARRVFCFAWPSQGAFGPTPYDRDRITALASGPAIALCLGRLFAKLAPLAEDDRPLLQIVCHSMGNRALSSALQSISLARPDLLARRYFLYALLMAADEDDDALGNARKLRPLLTLAKHIDVYTNESDLAMMLSWAANLHRPLGGFGPADFGQLPNQVIWVDCTDVGNTRENDGSSNYGHQYYRLSEPVLADVRQVLAGKAPDKVAPRIPDPDYPTRKFAIPFNGKSAWATGRGYRP
ncbi:alpha/beta hydrolase [Methylobacterium durans]|nr:alpha/beta hydrolase [Methylobacterium durans]